MYKEIYYKALVYVIMEVDKSQDLKSQSGNPGETMVSLEPAASRLRRSQYFSSRSKDRKNPMFYFKGQETGRILSYLGQIQPFFFSY